MFDGRIISEDDIAKICAQHRHIITLSSFSKAEPLTPIQARSLILEAFWASLQSNEGRSTTVRAVVHPDAGSTFDVFKLKETIPFRASQITKIAPAVPTH